MAELPTTRLNMTKPSVDGSDNVWGGLLNTDLDIVDRVYRDLTGALTTTGLPNDQIVSLIHTGYVDKESVPGFRLLLRSGVSNTGPLTLDVLDAGGPEPVVKFIEGVEKPLAGGDFPLGYYGDFVYRPGAPGTAAWIFLNPASGVTASIPPASYDARGIIELATDVEAKAGTDSDRAITPLTLDAVLDTRIIDASSTVKGDVELATDAEAVEGTDTTRAVTPANLTAVDILRSSGANNQICESSNLIVRQASSSTVNISAVAAVLTNSAGLIQRFAGINVTVNITTAGAGGFDGVLPGASSSWYSIYLIGTTAGTVSALLSLSRGAKGPDPAATIAAGPTMPAGYTFRGYVGTVYRGADGTLGTFYQCGNSVSVPDGAGLTLDAANVNWQLPPNLAAQVPLEATTVRLYFIALAPAGTLTDSRIAPAAVVGGILPGTYGEYRLEGQGAAFSLHLTLGMVEAGKFYVRILTPAITTARVHILGYTL